MVRYGGADGCRGRGARPWPDRPARRWDCLLYTSCLCAHGLRVDKRFNEVFKDGRELSLTELEYRLLRLMMEHRGKIFSAENLYESVWGEPYFSVSANTVMVHIRKLRAKIEDDPQNPRIVKTVWGKGYRVE